MKECAYCGQEIISRQKVRKYCSDECGMLQKFKNRRDKRKTNRELKICHVCGSEFVGHGRSIYCSDDCKNRYKGQKGQVRVCKNCGNSFKQWGYNSGYMFCNALCREEFCNKKKERLNKKYVCQNCNKEYKKKAPVASKYGNMFCSRKCAFEKRRKNKEVKFSNVYFKDCKYCGNLFTTRFESKLACSEVCRAKYDYLHNGDKHKEASKERYYKTRRKEKGYKLRNKMCDYCGKPFVTWKSLVMVCSVECRNKRNKIIHEANNKKRRLKERSKVIHTNINIRDLHKRDKGICGICGLKVDMRRKHPHLLSASIDHILPIAKGGLHSWCNVQLAHFDCNMKKGVTVPKYRRVSFFELSN